MENIFFDIFDFRTSLTTYMLKIKHLEVYDSTFSHGLVIKKLTKIARNCNIESQYLKIVIHSELMVIVLNKEIDESSQPGCRACVLFVSSNVNGMYSLNPPLVPDFLSLQSSNVPVLPPTPTPTHTNTHMPTHTPLT